MFKRSMITVFLLIGLVVGLSLVSEYSQKNVISQLQQRTHADLNRYILTMRQKLARFRDIPQLLSSHPDLIRALRESANSNDIIRANKYLAQVNQVLGTRDTYLMSANGMTVSASNWQSNKSFIGLNFNFRPYFTKAMSGVLGQYFALGTTSKKRGFYYSYPVVHRGKTLGVIVVKIDLNEIEQDWNERDIELIVSDEDGVIFISTREDWKFRTLKSLHHQDLARIKASKRYSDIDLVPLRITQSIPGEHNSQVITMREPNLGKSKQQYLIQHGVVGNSDLNVSILADLESVQRQVLANMLYVGTVYVAIVLLVMVIIAKRRINKQRALFEHRELQALESSEGRVKAILNNTWAGLITLDTGGHIESMNVTAQKLFNYTEDQLCGQLFYPLLQDVDEDLYLSQIDPKRLDSGETLIEGRINCSNGEILPVEFVVGKMRQSEALHFLVTVHDITERKQYEDQLDQSRRLLESRVEQRTAELTMANERLLQEVKQQSHTQNELIQTAKLAVIGQMSAGINHELNQPLMAIRGYADNARKFLELNKVQNIDNNLVEIAQLTERMAKILHPLKEFSRKSSGQQQTVSLTTLRSGVMAILYPELEKSKVTLDWLAPFKDVEVMGDLLRLEQVMVNLIANAMQALSENTQPSIKVSQIVTCDKQLEIRVRDNGPGIGEAELAQIFEPFFTTKQEGLGLGLGLSISQRIIEDLSGSISAENYQSEEQGELVSGAQFTLLLPINEHSIG